MEEVHCSKNYGRDIRSKNYGKGTLLKKLWKRYIAQKIMEKVDCLKSMEEVHCSKKYGRDIHSKKFPTSEMNWSDDSIFSPKNTWKNQRKK